MNAFSFIRNKELPKPIQQSRKKSVVAYINVTKSVENEKGNQNKHEKPIVQTRCGRRRNRNLFKRIINNISRTVCLPTEISTFQKLNFCNENFTLRKCLLHICMPFIAFV